MDIQAVRNAIAAAGLSGTAQQVHAALVAPLESGTTPVRLSMAGLALAITRPSRLALFEHPRFEALKADIDGQKRAEVASWAFFFLDAGVITSEDKAAVDAYLASTEADTRSRAERAGLAGLSVEQVRRAQMGD